jgi:protein-tyrosine-phosphatase
MMPRSVRVRARLGHVDLRTTARCTAPRPEQINEIAEVLDRPHHAAQRAGGRAGECRTQRGAVRISSRPEAPPVTVSSPAVLLFVCYANCCRSVLASFLYRRFCAGDAVRSAGLEPGERTSDRALAMLRCWGIDAAGHVPTKLNRRLCDEAGAIFVMAPPYLRRLLLEYGEDLASKAYLFADPFTRPSSLEPGAYTVSDPSFDERSAVELAEEFAWMRERALQIRRALLGRDRPLIAAATYLDVLESVDPMGH